ncbi:MAG TPA: hypothetical protein ENI76_01970 [Ignavibacteria bacterium]|nr:hypothetical protein [Ignavibacteria bacterium]
MPQTHKQKIGKIGEDIACRFLVNRGFVVIERNYWKKWGEIDIISKKNGILHFVEVKTVSCENLKSAFLNNTYRPEDNLHKWKLQRLSRTIQTYLFKKSTPEDSEWQFDVIIVFLDQETKKAKVRFLKDIIL